MILNKTHLLRIKLNKKNNSILQNKFTGYIFAFNGIQFHSFLDWIQKNNFDPNRPDDTQGNVILLMISNPLQVYQADLK